MIPSFLAAAVLACGSDPRAGYDVQAYAFDWAVVPDEQRLEGSVLVTARVVADELALFRLDLKEHLEVRGVTLADGTVLSFTHASDRIDVPLDPPRRAGDELAVRVRYGGEPRAKSSFDGFHWERTADGRPWIGTSCQGTGAHDWYPCKASYFHPEDKPERVSARLVVPEGLYGVTNGRLLGVDEGAPEWFDAPEGSWRTYRWEHPYPLETYAVTLNVAPYVVVEQALDVPGLEEPVSFVYYVLPEDAEKAAVQFAEVPRLIEVYSEAFGPFPFPDSKVGLVQTSFWGMEHSTAVAYGSSFPAWCEQAGERDRFARSNQFFDYILIHEMAHEWWGNAVSARDWGHFWIHEGFGTYAEGVWVERTQGREQADRYFRGQARQPVRSKGSLYRGDHPDSGQAYTGLIYSKGACVLNTLRHFLGDDEVWWRTLREFNLEFRYGNADTADFQRLLERNSGREWGRFFEEWFYGGGTPSLEGEVARDGRAIVVSIDNDRGTFHVPLDLTWREGDAERAERLWLEPGRNEHTIDCGREPAELQVVHLERVLGSHRVTVRP